MANEEQLALLRRDVSAWNLWRRDVVARIDQSDANLSDTKLSDANLSDADLSDADLTGAELALANLSGAHLSGANLTDADLTGADLTDASLWDANLLSAYLPGADLSGAHLSGANLTDADLTGANLTDANLTRVDLSGANLTRTSLSTADLSSADLSGANLSSAYLPGADLTGARLSGANLTDADLTGANLTDADLSSADLSGASLSGASLIKANLTRADLSGANLTRAELGEVVLADLNLSLALGLDSCEHQGPSTLDIRTLLRSRDLPLRFLRGCGVPDHVIDYLPSLTEVSPIQFYSVFISYTTANQDFADRLFSDLQANGVRCWFAPHHIEPGKKIHDQIDTAIRLYDRLLLVLSRESMTSTWVKTEIAKARKKAHEQKRPVLFPILLVPFQDVRTWEQFDADIGDDSAKEIREYFLPDFSQWKDHDAYTRQFDALLKALKNADERVS